MKILSNAEHAKLLKANRDAYQEGYDKGRSDAHESDFIQDISFNDVEYVFDFRNPGVRVFSIERSDVGTDKEETVIGYLDVEGIVRLWHFHCSRTHHNKLVEQWNQAKQSPFVTKKK
jgi:hypothetical protein